MQRSQYKEERSSSWVIKYGKVDDDGSFAKIKEEDQDDDNFAKIEEGLGNVSRCLERALLTGQASICYCGRTIFQIF